MTGNAPGWPACPSVYSSLCLLVPYLAVYLSLPVSQTQKKKMAKLEMIDDHVNGLLKIFIRMMLIYYNGFFFSIVCYRFKVFADYEDYIKCQEQVNELYKVGVMNYLH
jgi:hypothetical protein